MTNAASPIIIAAVKPTDLASTLIVNPNMIPKKPIMRKTAAKFRSNAIAAEDNANMPQQSDNRFLFPKTPDMVVRPVMPS